MPDNVTMLPTAAQRRVRNPETPADEWVELSVPDAGAEGAARREWHSDRWHAFHLYDPTAEEPITQRLHHQFRRRRA